MLALCHIIMCSVTQSSTTLCDPVDYSQPGSSVHEILQARILEWVAMLPPGDLPNPGTEAGSPSLQADSLLLSHQVSPLLDWQYLIWFNCPKHRRNFKPKLPSVRFSSVAQLCPILCNPMNWSTPGLPVHHQLPELTQTQVHWVGDVIQPPHPLSSPSPPTINLSQHQGLFKWVSSSHQVAKVLEFQLQHQSFQWIFRTDLL